MLKLYFLLLVLLGISACTPPEKKPEILKEIPSPVLVVDTTTFSSIFPPPPIDSAFLAIQGKIYHTMSYCDYCGPTRVIDLHFDRTGCLVASSLGPWIRNAIPVIPEHTVHLVYSDENPAPSRFFSDRHANRHYFYNNKTKKVQKLAYEKLNCASEGLVGVAKRTEEKEDSYQIKYAFLNEKLEPICDFIYDNVEDFEYGVAVVEKEDQKGILNKRGREIIPCKYESIEVLESKRIQVRKKNYKFDLFTLKGRLIRKNYTE